MWNTAVSILAVLTAALVVGLGASAAQSASGGEPAPSIRIGTYDNRAVTIAWFHSEYNDLSTLRQQLAEAEAAGDEARVAELRELGPKLQRRLHLQGFGRAPVTDLLEPVEDRLVEVARAVGVDAIVFECNYAGEGVEVVDVTDALVKLFNPPAEALKTIGELLKQDPVPLEDLKDEH